MRMRSIIKGRLHEPTRPYHDEKNMQSCLSTLISTLIIATSGTHHNIYIHATDDGRRLSSKRRLSIQGTCNTGAWSPDCFSRYKP